MSHKTRQLAALPPNQREPCPSCGAVGKKCSGFSCCFGCDCGDGGHVDVQCLACGYDYVRQETRDQRENRITIDVVVGFLNRKI